MVKANVRVEKKRRFPCIANSMGQCYKRTFYGTAKNPGKFTGKNP